MITLTSLSIHNICLESIPTVVNYFANFRMRIRKHREIYHSRYVNDKPTTIFHTQAGVSKLSTGSVYSQ